MRTEELDEGDKQLLSDVVEYGLHVLYVLEDDDGPGFGYSVGLYHNYKHPEIIVIGLTQELTHNIINDMASEIKAGKIYKVGEYASGILDGFDRYFLPVDKSNYREYVGYANWFYERHEFPLIQCVYPTTKGIYPWEEAWPDSIKNLQPLLCPINKPNQL